MAILAILLVAAGRPPLLTAAAPVTAPAPAVAALPAGFVAEPVLTGLPLVTAVAFAPDGRIFLAEKSGHVRIAQNGVVLPGDFIDISAQVNNTFDRGLGGLALHPDFPNTPYVYLWFVYDPPDLPRTNVYDSPDGMGGRVSRLIRVSADPAHPNQALPGSEVVLVGQNSTLANIAAVAVDGDGYDPLPPPSCGAAPNYVADCVPADGSSHNVGTVAFGPDGALYVGHGDGGNYILADPRVLRVQSLDSLAGKILRIDPLTGLGYPNNPFYDGNPASNRSRIWDYGLRNPYRFSFQPGTGQIILGDVGWLSWEEIDVGGGRNFGWPCYEGLVHQPEYASAAGTAATCAALYAQEPAAVTMPIYAVSRPWTEYAAFIGGVYTTGSPYPAGYHDVYFFADYTQNKLFVMHPGPGDGVTVELFGQPPAEPGSLAGPVQMLLGPDHNLYYLMLGWQGTALWRLRYVSGDNAPPVAHLTAAPTYGSLPLTVDFSAAASLDPDAQPLTYAWDFGDGGAGTGVTTAHTYTVAGTYTAVLTVADTLGLTATAQIAIAAGNHPPRALLRTPLEGTLVSAGQGVTFTGTGLDEEDGLLPDAALEWSLQLHHFDHIHPNALPPTVGRSGSFVAPDHGDNTWFELCLTATDSGGLHATACRPLWPRVSPLALRTAPSGLALTYAGAAHNTPVDVALQVGAQRTLNAPAEQSGWTFSGWTDGVTTTSRALTGTLVTQVFTATYFNLPPVAVASVAPAAGWGPLSVVFTASSSYDPSSTAPLSYLWDFGDGATAATATALHVYTFGDFTATLTISDLAGLTDSLTFLIAAQAQTRVWLPLALR